MRGPSHNGRVFELTAKEREVLGYVARGLCSVSIAAELGVGAASIDKYRHNAREKLGLNSSAELVAWAKANVGTGAK